MSNGLYTTDPMEAISDSINLAFQSEKWSIPSSDIGFDHSIDGIDSSILNEKIGDRIKELATKVANSMALRIDVVSIKFDPTTNSYDTVLKASNNEYKISIKL